MEIDKIKKYTTRKAIAGKRVDVIKKTLKDRKYERQDAQEGLQESYKPLLDKQEELKNTIDEKQNKIHSLPRFIVNTGESQSSQNYRQIVKVSYLNQYVYLSKNFPFK